MSDFNEAFKNMLMCNTTFGQMVTEFQNWVAPGITIPVHLTGLHVLIFRNNVLKPNEKIQLAKIIAEYGALPSNSNMKKILLPVGSAQTYKPLIIYYCDLGAPPNLGKYSWEELEPIIMESRDPVATAFNVANNMLVSGKLQLDMDSNTFVELMRRFSLKPEDLHMSSSEVIKRLTVDQIANDLQVIDHLRTATMRNYVSTVLNAVGVSTASKVKVIEYIWTKHPEVFQNAEKTAMKRICDDFQKQGMYQFLERYLVYGCSTPVAANKTSIRISAGRILIQDKQYEIIDRVISSATIPADQLQSFRVTFRAGKSNLSTATVTKLWSN